MLSKIKNFLSSKIIIQVHVVTANEIQTIDSKIQKAATGQPDKISNSTKIVTTPKLNSETSETAEFRFVQEEQPADIEGEPSKIFYFTEKFKKDKWVFVSNSLAYDKDAAIDIHVKLLENKNIKQENIKTTLWEGLDASAVRCWSALQK